MIQPRDPVTGKMLHGLPALVRFASKCRFDPTTGCVLWTGGTTAGHGKTQRYGSFWFEGKPWLAHRWSAVHIHGITLGDRQGGHCCPHGPNTLCVEHIEAQTGLENNLEQHARLGNPAHRATQSARERQYWLLIEVGAEQPPAVERLVDSIPIYDPPSWLQPFLPVERISDDCPF